MLRRGGYGQLLSLVELSLKRPTAACQRASSQQIITSTRAASSVSLLNTKQVREPQRIRTRKPTEKEPVKKDLQPHVLSGRLKRLCDTGRLNEAIAVLKNAPLDAQNPPVWNTVIWECMKAQQYSLAYKLYIDMKRRGFSPTTRTYQTMLTGLSKIKNWKTHSKQLANAHSLYDSFMIHIASVKKHDPESKQLDTAPINAYFRILGDAGLQQQMFDVYYDLDTEGPMAPDHMVYTAMFTALASKSTTVAEISATNPLVSIQHASNARLLWSLMIKARSKKEFLIDSFLVTGAITALSRGRPSDQALAFTLAKEHFGISLEGDEPVPQKPGQLALNSSSLAAIISLCNLSEHQSEAPYILEQIKKRPEASGGASIIDRGIIEDVLRSFLAVPTPSSHSVEKSTVSSEVAELVQWAMQQDAIRRSENRIRLRRSTLNVALQVCWRQTDWRAARKVFETLTGWRLHDFADGVARERPNLPPRDEMLVHPDVEAVGLLVRTAAATKNGANMREALRLVSYLRMLEKSSTHANKVERSHKSVKSEAFFRTKLAEAVLETSSMVLSEQGNKNLDPQEWKGISETARAALGTKMF